MSADSPALRSRISQFPSDLRTELVVNDEHDLGFAVKKKKEGTHIGDDLHAESGAFGERPPVTCSPRPTAL